MENGNKELKCINHYDVNSISYCDSCTGRCHINETYTGERAGLFVDKNFIKTDEDQIKRTKEWTDDGLILIDIRPTCRAIAPKSEPLDMSGRPLFTIACPRDRSFKLLVGKLREE